MRGGVGGIEVTVGSMRERHVSEDSMQLNLHYHVNGCRLDVRRASDRGAQLASAFRGERTLWAAARTGPSRYRKGRVHAQLWCPLRSCQAFREGMTDPLSPEGPISDLAPTRRILPVEAG